MTNLKILALTYLLFSNLSFSSDSSSSSEGMIRIKSKNSVQITLDKLEKSLKSKGMTVFTRIDHSKGASKAGLKLSDTSVLIFGNPKIGTILMNCNQRVGIDLPLKAVSYKDKSDQVWLEYNSPSYLAKRHGIEKCAKKVLPKMNKALKGFMKEAVK